MTRITILAPLMALAACQISEPVAAPKAVTAIPSAFRGRWGLTEAECTADPSIAKGLMAIDAEKISFYESRGRLSEGVSTPTRLEGSFAYSGEGQTWTRRETLDLQDGGMILIRREYGDDAAPGLFRYVACR